MGASTTSTTQCENFFVRPVFHAETTAANSNQSHCTKKNKKKQISIHPIRLSRTVVKSILCCYV